MSTPGAASRRRIIYDSPLAGVKRTITYHRLLTETQVLGGMLRDLGVGKGDRVILYMPMVPEAVIAMLACARIGAIHSVVFGGFAARELATRIDDATPKVILSASCGLEPGRVVAYKPLLDEAIALAKHKPDACLILQRPQSQAALIEGRDRDWAAMRDHALVHARNAWDCVPVAATDPLYILYTSGTTGRPERRGARQWRPHGRAAMVDEESLRHRAGRSVVDGVRRRLGGRPFLHRLCAAVPRRTSILYEGKPVGTPDAGAFWRVIAEHGAVAMFTAPTAFRAIKKEDPDGQAVRAARSEKIPHAVSRRRARRSADAGMGRGALEGAGDRSLVADRDRLVHRRQSDGPRHAAGQARLADGADAGLRRARRRRGLRMKSPRNKMGSIVIKLPLPPACLPTLWQADARMRESYLDEFPGYYKTADAGFKDDDGYVFVMGRTDDIINVAGHRLSTGGMEEVLAAHPDVAECAVLGIKDELKGEVPCGFIVLKSGVNRPPTEIEKECVALIRDKIGPVAAFKLAITVARLPKTRSGKILRGTIKKIADGDTWQMPATIDDPAILDEIGSALKGKGVGA